MPFEKPSPEWNAPGVEPPLSKKNAGWVAGEKPPADYWNWQMNLTHEAIEELQQKAAEAAALNAHKNAATLDHPNGSVTDAKIGNRTIDDTVVAAAGADTPTRLWSKIGYILKGLMGTANWWTLPSMTITAIITALGLKAPTNSPNFTGIPTAPTAALGTNTIQVATMQAVKAAFDAVPVVDTSTFAPKISPPLSGIPTAPTAATSTNTNQIATAALAQAKVDQAIANLLDSAPGALDTLNELAAAMGDDPNFAATMTNALALKLNSSSYTAADVLAKLLTVDGAGSGLDADLLGGAAASLFARLAGPIFTGTVGLPATTSIGSVSATEIGYLDGVTSAIQTQLAARLANTDYIRQPGYGVTTGSANTYVLALSPALTAYAAGVAVAVRINVTNTGASTLNVSAIGARNLKKPGDVAFAAGELVAGSVYTFRDNGTDFILQGEGGGGSIKNVQRGEYTFSTSEFTKNITISAVDVTKSIIIVSSFADSGSPGYVSTHWASGVITNSTTITIERGASELSNCAVSWQVIEFQNVKSLQTGSVAAANSTVAIAPVDLSKSFVIFSATSVNTGTNSFQIIAKVWLSSSTQLSIVGGSNGRTVKWQVIEFN